MYTCMCAFCERAKLTLICVYKYKANAYTGFCSLSKRSLH